MFPPPTPPTSFQVGEPIPPEYVSPYPAPRWYPQSDSSVTYPSWVAFWNNNVPSWPPVYPPITPYFPQLSGAPLDKYEELCCVGFNPEDSCLEAIIEIKQQSTQRTCGYCRGKPPIASTRLSLVSSYHSDNLAWFRL